MRSARLNNHCLFKGHLAGDPRVRANENGAMEVSFLVITVEALQDKKGDWIEDRQYHTVVAQGELAYKVMTYLKEGMGILVCSRATHRTIEYDEDERDFVTEFILDEFQVLSPRSEDYREDELPF